MKASLMSSKAGGAKSSHPQCKVCGDESSGFHYGVDSCEGCKGFFRRCITQGMTHKCANEQRCEITPFTRNSCQYCRLKKCIEVGMSREASRLGRRPKRLKVASGESSRSHTSNLPIAPYPTPQELHSLKMAELQKLLMANGADKSDLMQAFLAAAQSSFREHARSSGSHLSTSSTSTLTSLSSSVANNNTTTTTPSSSSIPAAVNAPQLPSPSSSAATTSILAPDVNLNVTPPNFLYNASAANLNLGGGVGGTAKLVNIGSPSSSSSMQMPSPFPDLSDLSPFPASLNLNMGGPMYDNIFGGQDMNFNGNSLYPNSQPMTDNSPSPIFLPSMDNLDPCASPSDFLTSSITSPSSTAVDGANTPRTINTGGMTSSDSAYNPQQQQNNGSTTTTAPVAPQPVDNNNGNLSTINTTINTTTTDNMAAPDTKTNLNINTNITSGITSQFSATPTIISPNFIKQEQTDTTVIKQEPTEQSCYLSSKTLHEASVFDLDKVLLEVKMMPTKERLLLIHQVMDLVTEAHLTTTINTRANVAVAKERIKGCELSQLNDMPDMSKLSLSASEMWQQFLISLVPEITKVVKFSKKLPGFTNIAQDDQISLIKQGTIEVMVARYTVLVDHVNDLMLDPQLKMLSPRHVILDVPMGQFLDEVFPIAKQVNPLCLTDGEVGLFTSILMMNPGRDNVKNRFAVKRIQDLFLQTLYFLIRGNHADPDYTFTALIASVGLFNKINEDHAKFLSNIKMKEPSQFESQFPALHKEVFEV